MDYSRTQGLRTQGCMVCKARAVDWLAFSRVMLAGPCETYERAVEVEDHPHSHPPHAAASWRILDDKDHFVEPAGLSSCVVDIGDHPLARRRNLGVNTAGERVRRHDQALVVRMSKHDQMSWGLHYMKERPPSCTRPVAGKLGRTVVSHAGRCQMPALRLNDSPEADHNRRDCASWEQGGCHTEVEGLH